MAFREVTVNLYTDAQSVTGKDFGKIALFSDLLTSFSANEFKEYFSRPELAADADVDAVTAAQADRFLAANPHCSSLKLGQLTAAYASLKEDLAVIEAADPDWYGFVLGGTAASASAQVNVEEAAEWAESNGKLYLAQSDEAAVLAKTASNVLEDLKGFAYARTAFTWYGDDSVLAALQVGALKLAVDPDKQATSWADVNPLPGLTALHNGGDALTDTETDNIIDQYGNTVDYLDDSGVVVFSPGICVNGKPIASLIAADWLSARLHERVLQLKLDVAARGQKIPYLDRGIQQIATVLRGVMKDGVKAGHFASLEDELNDPTGVIKAPQVIAPLRSECSAADVAAKKVTFTCTAFSSGEIVEVVVNAYMQGA